MIFAFFTLNDVRRKRTWSEKSRNDRQDILFSKKILLLKIKKTNVFIISFFFFTFDPVLNYNSGLDSLHHLLPVINSYGEVLELIIVSSFKTTHFLSLVFK